MNHKETLLNIKRNYILDLYCFGFISQDAANERLNALNAQSCVAWPLIEEVTL
jgi:hypothetical protein